MGLVTDKVLELVGKQVQARRVVVWFDRERAYQGLVSRRDAVAGAPLFRYEPDRGFMALRRDLEPMWSAATNEPPQLVIYVPLAQTDTHSALVEFTSVGAVLEPGAQPPECNTHLAAVARLALASLLPAKTVEQLVSDIEAERLNLAELDSEAEKNAQVRGALTLVFGTGNLQEIALRFLSDTSVDEDLAKRGSVHTLADLFISAFEVSLPDKGDLASIRARLIRHLLTTDFLQALHGAPPERLSTLPRATNTVAIETVVQLVREWRLRRDLAGAYDRAAKRVEAEIGVGDIPWTFEALQETETFYRTELELQSLSEIRLAERIQEPVLRLAHTRVNGFWSSLKPESKLRWQIAAQAGDVLQQVDRIEREWKGHSLPAEGLLTRYTEGDAPWCDLDTAYRHLERDYYRLDVEEVAHDSLIKLVTQAQQRYREWVDTLANRFVQGYEAAKFDLSATHQTDIFRSFVAPSLQEGSVAYILVDALRYEMARELLSQLPEEWKAKLTPALATAPTITQVGMSALMPGAERGVGLTGTGGNLSVDLGGDKLKTSLDRAKYLEKQVAHKTLFTELSHLAPLTSKKLRKSLSEARLIVVSASDEIDGLWETNPTMARQMQEDVYNQLRRGMRSLFNVGVSKIVITSDHGFLFGTQLIPGETIDPPGGEEVALKRRVWLGKGGAAVPSCLREPITALGVSGDLELVTPYGLACFKVAGGSMVYFHGGLSLQECAIPVLVVSPGKASREVGPTKFTWKLTSSVKKIATRFFSVQVEGEAADMFSSPPRVRVEVRDGDRILSLPVSATYGFQQATGDVLLQFDEKEPRHIIPNSVTLQITEIPSTPTVTLYLLDSESGATLTRNQDVPVEIAL